jgi:very-short-patch-repair endonuclease
MSNTTRSRQLRKNLTDAERTLWNILRKRQLSGCKFRRQVPIGSYIVDFVCLENKLVIEVDGGQHTELESYDAGRTAWLEREGFRVIRFWNNQVLTDTDSVQDAIWMAVKDLLPSPLRGEG